LHPAAGRASRNRVPGLPPPTAAARAGPDAAGLLAEIRRQRHTGQSRIVAALDAPGRARPGLDSSEAADMVCALLSPDVHRILTVERGWTADRHERRIARTPSTLLRTGHRPPASPDKAAEPGSPGSAADQTHPADRTSHRRSERSFGTPSPARMPITTRVHNGRSRAIAAASDHDAAQPVFQSASVLIAE